MDTSARLKNRMLRRITSLFERNNIPYWLESGTLLGILRQNDHLPWPSSFSASQRQPSSCHACY